MSCEAQAGGPKERRDDCIKSLLFRHSIAIRYSQLINPSRIK
jgi:hypothetical protein